MSQLEKIAREARRKRRERALALGNGLDAASVPELLGLLGDESASIRTLAASALSKVIAANPDLGTREIAMRLCHALSREEGPQAARYMLKTLRFCAPMMDLTFLDSVRDVVFGRFADPAVQKAAEEVLVAVEERHREKVAFQSSHCAICGASVTTAEARGSLDQCGRVYCRKHRLLRALEAADFEHKVTEHENILTEAGLNVQSRGEKLIADWLDRHHIAYEYDRQHRITREQVLRPDFYLPEFAVFIEYWGLKTPKYLAMKAWKLELYKRARVPLISIEPRNVGHLDDYLAEKLSRYFRVEPPPARRCRLLVPLSPCIFGQNMI